ncbi:MAG: hypothetical protein JXP48_10005 [Acidobacteria bacterium]|nr:hypothetical protein [Acidobacteriota bacterium]
MERRPRASAIDPNRIEPRVLPMSSVGRTMPSAARSRFHSAAIPGEA